MTDAVLDQRADTLPSGWLWKPFGELVTHSQNGISKRRSTTGTPTPVLRLADIREGEIVESSPREIRLCDEELSKYALRDGDLLCVRVNGSRTLTGRLVYFRSRKLWAYCDHFIRFRLESEIAESKYFAHYFNTEAVRSYLGKHMVSTAGQNTVSQGIMLGVAVPLAPVNQQRAIVEEIEKQFSRLDEAVANLKRVKANLKRYKASVLKAAVEGKLTEDWRKQHPNVEPAGKLLERILAERRKKWAGRGRYHQPGEPETSHLPELPGNWIWARLDAITSLKGGITVDKNRKSSTARTVPYLRVANVQRGYLDLSEIKTIEAPDDDIKDLRLIPGDILFNEGGDRDKLGRGWVWEGQLPECIHQNHVFRARLYSAEVLPKLVSWWGNSFGQAYFLREGKQTTNLASLNLTKLSEFPIPLPPAAEQQQIVDEVERSLSVIDELEATVQANLTRAERLRQSILKCAFSGDLVDRNKAVANSDHQLVPMIQQR
ncbi:MAG: restriction endonuclease subunit S [Nitrospira sp.]|nr:restriction endonuclease subunit S [Nitrospira sp.]MDH5194526.1 restriction endonuclease subunit S [Nitrospira sp.]